MRNFYRIYLFVVLSHINIIFIVFKVCFSTFPVILVFKFFYCVFTPSIKIGHTVIINSSNLFEQKLHLPPILLVLYTLMASIIFFRMSAFQCLWLANFINFTVLLLIMRNSGSMVVIMVNK